MKYVRVIVERSDGTADTTDSFMMRDEFNNIGTVLESVLQRVRKGRTSEILEDLLDCAAALTSYECVTDEEKAEMTPEKAATITAFIELADKWNNP